MPESLQNLLEKRGKFRILWHSVSAHVGSGYGNTTRNICSRLVKRGYEVIVSAYYGLEPGGSVKIHGILHLPAKIGKFGKESCISYVNSLRPDIAVLNTDWWAFPWFPKLPSLTLCHSPMDHENYPEEIIKLTSEYDYVCAYSKWQQRCLKERGLDSYYTPHGVDTKIFRPMDKEKCREIVGFPKEKFIILRVAANCFDPETEILTKEGWKKYYELKYNDLFVTLNKEGLIEYQKPERIIIQTDYSGVMYKLKTKYLDIMVTPNHRLLVKRKITLRKDRPKEMKIRKKIGKSYFFTEYYPEYAVDNYGKPRWFKKNGKWAPSYKISSKYKSFRIEDFIELLGYYIAEGNIQDNLIIINQRKEQSKNKILECIKRMKLQYSLYIDKIAIRNSELLEEFKKLGKASNKYIPRWVLDLHKEYLEILWKALVLGDGWKTGSSESYSTTSYKLAGQIQELLLKMGYAGDICIKKSKNKNWKDCYVIHRNTTVLEVQKRGTSKREKKLFTEEWIPYEGLVWSVEVPNHTVYVRRNGKVVWSCQSDKEDRKSHSRCFKAIRLFLEDNPDAKKDIFVYCHTNPKDPRGYPLHYVVHKQGLDDIVRFFTPNIHHLRLSTEEMVTIYNTSDILLNPCYSEDTRLLTEDGLKELSEISYKDRVWTLNDKGELELNEIQEIFINRYKGKMIHFKNKQLDLLVTPNHRIYFSTPKKRDKLQIKEAKEFLNKSSRYYLPTTGEWRGVKLDFIYTNEYNKDLYRSAKTLPDKIPVNELLKLIGWYISEGSLYKEKDQVNPGKICISNTNPEYQKEIIEIFNNLSIQASIDGDNVIAHSVALCKILKQFGTNARNKRIVQWVLMLSKEQLKYLFETMMKGDGSIKGHHCLYYTSSDKLKDDFIELCLKLGYSTKVWKRKVGERQLKGRILEPKEDWMISIRTKNNAGSLDTKEDVQEIPYEGLIWCVTTENGNVFVERNGLLVCSGNSKREGFGLPIIEALACGKPVIVTDFSSMTELGKGHGWLVKNLLDKENLITTPLNADSSLPDVYSIKDAIEDAYNHPDKCEKYGKAGRRFALDYDWDRIIEKIWIPMLDDIQEREKKKREERDKQVRESFRNIYKRIKEGKKI